MKSVGDVFKRLVPLLAEAIPRKIAELKLTKPIWCLRIYYYDTHAPCTYLSLAPLTAASQAKLLQGKAPDYLWISAEERDITREVHLNGPEPVTSLFARVYDLLCEDENKYMISFRAMVQQVARELNQKDWSKTCPVTDDFVVVPADGSAHFCDEAADIFAAVPAKRIELLRSRGFGPPPEWSQS